MRYIKKSGTEPEDLQKYKRDCRRASPPLKITYKDMPKDGSRKQLAVDQGYICAYCMRRVCLDSENKEQYITISVTANERLRQPLIVRDTPSARF